MLDPAADGPVAGARGAVEPPAPDQDAALDVRAALGALLVLRFYCDLSVDEAPSMRCAARSAKDHRAIARRWREQNMDDETARALLERAAADEPPPARVSIEMARRRGRAMLVRRRASAGGPALAAVAVAAVAVAGIGPFGASGHQGGERRPESAGTGRILPPRRFSPLAPYAAFGWLPHGDTLNGGQLTGDCQYLTAGRNPAMWTLTVYADGNCGPTVSRLVRQLRHGASPRLTCATSAISGWSEYVIGEAPRVAGHLAFWTAGHGSLAWPYARDSWAVLSLVRDPAARAEAVTIARHVRYAVSAGPTVEFPAQLTGLPAGSRVSFTYFVADGAVLRASEYSLAVPGQLAPMLTTNLARAGSRCYVYPGGQSVRRVIHGYQVVVTHLTGTAPPVRQVCAARADGLFVFVSTYGAHARPGAVSIFARHLRLLGPDPNGWTTRPVA